MITVITVEIHGCKNHAKILYDSIIKRSKLVTNVIVAQSDASEYYEERWKEGDIEFLRVGNPCEAGLWFGHGLGLHAALDHVKTEFVMFSDPDVFWYTSVDEFFIDLYDKHDLNYIGVSHHNAVNQAFAFFPYVITSMAKVSTLPDKDWLKGKLKYRGPKLHRAELANEPDDDHPLADGKYLIPNPIPGLCETYPNKNGDALFDIGCNMWLWNEERRGRWLSFQTSDCHIYTTRYNRSNFKFKERLPNKKLIYHLGSSSRNEIEDYERFKKEYEESFMEND